MDKRALDTAWTVIPFAVNDAGQILLDTILESWTNVLRTPESHIPLEQVKACAEIGIQCMDDDQENRPTTWDIILRLFDEEEISNWSARGAIGTSSTAQRVGELGCQMHVAMATAVVCPESETMTPKIIFTKKLKLLTTMDVHPTEPWILVIQSFKQVYIWNYRTQEAVMSWNYNATLGWAKKMLDFKLLVNAAKFIPRKKWFVLGDEAGDIRVFSYVTWKEINKFGAYHLSPVHSLAVHPTSPLLITMSSRRDNAIRLWDWEMGWKCTRRIRGGGACGDDTRLKFNPKDTTRFAGANDKTCHVWSIHSSEPLINISPPNCDKPLVCDYLYTDSHREYLIASVKGGGISVWDLQTVECVHPHLLYDKIIGPVACHPALPVIVAGSRDGNHSSVSFWNSSNYRLLKTVRCTLGCWEGIVSVPFLGKFGPLIGGIKDFAFVGSRRLVIGFYDGIEVLEIDLEALLRQSAIGTAELEEN